METMNVTLTPEMLAVIPTLAVALQMVKGIEPLARFKAWMPLVAIAIAIGCAILMGIGATIQEQVMSGLIMGLATAGGYDASRISGKVTESSEAAKLAAAPKEGGSP